MEVMNDIGLDEVKVFELSEQLNELLSNYQIFYMNARGFHWNIKGRQFFELHVKFEELYNDLLLKVDELAERILTLGHTPLHSYSEYAKRATIAEAKNITSGDDAVSSILSSFSAIIEKQRAILADAGDADDEGTSALMSDYIREQEKLVWMYRAYLSQ